MAKNDGILILGLLALWVFGSKKSSAPSRRSMYIASYSPYVMQETPIPEAPPAGSNIPTSLKGFKTPSQAIKYAPSGAGVVLHSRPKASGGYAIR